MSNLPRWEVVFHGQELRFGHDDECDSCPRGWSARFLVAPRSADTLPGSLSRDAAGRHLDGAATTQKTSAGRRERNRASRPSATTRPGERPADGSARVQSDSARRPRIVAVAGARPELHEDRAADARDRAPRDASTPSWSTPASTTTRRCRTASSASSASREPDVNLGVGSGSHAVQTAEVMTALRADPARAAPRRGGRGRRRQLDAGRDAGGREARHPASRTSRRACARSTAPCPRRSTASSPTRSPTCSS